MTQDDLFNFKAILDDRKWKKRYQKRKYEVEFIFIKEISVRKDDPNCLYFKYNLKDNPSCLNTKIETRSHGRRQVINIELNKLYSQTLPLPEAKYILGFNSFK